MSSRLARLLALVALALLVAPRPAEAQRRLKPGERVSGLEPKPFRISAATSGRVSGFKARNHEASPFKSAEPIRYGAGSAGAQDLYPTASNNGAPLYTTGSGYDTKRELYRPQSTNPVVGTTGYPNRPNYKTYAFGFGANYVPVGSKVAPRKVIVSRPRAPITSILRPSQKETKAALTLQQSMSLLRPPLPKKTPIVVKKTGG